MKRSPEATTGLATHLLAAAVTLPFGINAFHILREAAHDLAMEGDFAIIELFTLHALDGTQITGPYSRFGWNHPGPAMFYLFAIPYALSGGQNYTLFAAAAMTNAAFAYGSVVVLRRFAGVTAAAMGAGVVSIYAMVLESLRTSTIWNPFLSLMPFMGFLACAAAVGRSWWPALPAGVLAGSFAVQCHVSFAPPVLLVAAATVVPIALARRREGLSPWPRGLAGRRSAVAALLIGAILWAPTAVHLARNAHDYIRMFGDYAAVGGGPLPFGQGIRAWALELTRVPAALVFGWVDESQAGPILWRVTAVLTVAQLGLVALSWRRARNLDDRALARCCAWSLAVSVLSLASILSIKGGLESYLTAFASTVGGFNWIAVGCVWLRGAERAPAARACLAARGGPDLRHGLLAAACVGAAAVAAVTALRAPARLRGARPVSDEMTAVNTAIDRFIERHRLRRPQILFERNAAWSTGGGVMAHLKKADVKFSAPPGWTSMFGAQHAPAGGEDGTIIIGDAGTLAVRQRTTCEVSVLARRGVEAAYAIDRNRFGAGARRPRVWRAEGVEARAAGPASNPASRDPGPEAEMRFMDGRAFIVYAAPPTAASTPFLGVRVAADAGVSFAVSCSADDATFTDVGIVSPLPGGGRPARVVVFPAGIGCAYVKVMTLDKTERAAIARVELLTEIRFGSDEERRACFVRLDSGRVVSEVGGRGKSSVMADLHVPPDETVSDRGNSVHFPLGAATVELQVPQPSAEVTGLLVSAEALDEYVVDCLSPASGPREIAAVPAVPDGSGLRTRVVPVDLTPCWSIRLRTRPETVSRAIAEIAFLRRVAPPSP